LEELEDLPTSSGRDVNHLDKELNCELKGTQLEAKTACQAVVKAAIISSACTCSKYSKWLLSFAFQTDKLVFQRGGGLPSRLAVPKDEVRHRWSPSSLHEGGPARR